MRIVEEHEAKLKALREAVQEGLNSEFTIDDEQLDRTIAEVDRKLKEQGIV